MLTKIVRAMDVSAGKCVHYGGGNGGNGDSGKQVKRLAMVYVYLLEGCDLYI